MFFLNLTNYISVMPTTKPNDPEDLLLAEDEDIIIRHDDESQYTEEMDDTDWIQSISKLSLVTHTNSITDDTVINIAPPLFEAKKYVGGIKEWWHGAKFEPFVNTNKDYYYEDLRDFFEPNLCHICFTKFTNFSDRFKQELAAVLFIYALKNFTLLEVTGINHVFPAEYLNELEKVLKRNETFMSKTGLIATNLGGGSVGLTAGFAIAPKAIAEGMRAGITFSATGILLTGLNALYYWRSKYVTRALQRFFHEPSEDYTQPDEVNHTLETNVESDTETTSLLARQTKLQAHFQEHKDSIAKMRAYQESFPWVDCYDTALKDIPTICFKVIVANARKKLTSDDEHQAFEEGVLAYDSCNPGLYWSYASLKQPDAFYSGRLLAYCEQTREQLDVTRPHSKNTV